MALRNLFYLLLVSAYSFAACGGDDGKASDAGQFDADGAARIDASIPVGDASIPVGDASIHTKLFQSGFESNVQILALDYDPLNLGYRYLQGGDVAPYIWGDGDVIGDDPFTGLIASYGDKSRVLS